MLEHLIIPADTPTRQLGNSVYELSKHVIDAVKFKPLSESNGFGFANMRFFKQTFFYVFAYSFEFFVRALYHFWLYR